MAVASRNTVRFFFDVVSPWSWMGFETITRYHHQYPGAFDLRLEPFFLGGVMKASGNQPPALLPAKAQYMFKDLPRSADYFGVSVNTPSVFPANTLTMQRVLTALSSDQHDIEPVVRQAWKAYWHDDRDISQPEVLLEVLAESGVKDGPAWLRKAAEQPTKDRLMEATTYAVKSGAFGAPWFIVTPSGSDQEHVFFGSDRFHLLFPLIGLPWTGPHPSKSCL